MNIEYFIENWKNIKNEDTSCNREEWGEISKYCYLTEDFIEAHEDQVSWNWISRRQKLSEEFIEKHKDKVNWFFIS